MGKLVAGHWAEDDPQSTASDDGSFKRPDSVLRSWVTPDGAPGPSGDGGFTAALGRYHLYVAINCPWAHRTMIMRKLKELEDIVSMSIVRPNRGAEGWTFDDALGYPDDLFRKKNLHEIYTRSHADYTGRVTVPVLFDKEQGLIVSNESSEIIRMFNSAFNEWADTTTDYYPHNLQPVIDEWNERIYATVNNGVYRAGFARSQEAYEKAYDDVFETLDALDAHLGANRYIAGATLTEADIRALPTLVRFDVAYYGAFRCNKKKISDYDNLSGYVRELCQLPGVAETVNTDIYKGGYYSMSKERNPLGIIPKGPVIDFRATHGRAADTST
jgi:putative glutathione S-transferase